jgi:tRNA modification GTPase
MATLAALVTPRGPGAIATVKLTGDSAAEILSGIFRPASSIPSISCVAVGKLTDGNTTIDQVVLACEAEGSYAINCHGSPLVAEVVMETLRKHGAQVVGPRLLRYHELRRDASLNSIAIEAALDQTASLTAEGTNLIISQLTTGLVPLAMRWSSLLSADTLPHIKAEASQAAERWDISRLIIQGARIVLTGPPNSGKSTLLNALAGRSTSIVADEPGTTRDYVSAGFTAPPLALEVIDTAGLDAEAAHGQIDAAAQERSAMLLSSADLVILVLDSTRPACQFDKSLLSGRPTVTVCNKCDAARLDIPGAMHVSASQGTNLSGLAEVVKAALGVERFDAARPAAFTQRQSDILLRLAAAPDEAAARRLITELLNGPLSV